MATNNITFPIYNANGTPFNGLVLRNATFDSVVMSLGDKITGDVYYMDNTLAVTMSEYIEYKRNEDSEEVKFVLVNPPTVVREGVVSDNSELHGMTKYSFVFYHPMYAVSNFPFTDVAVSSDEQKYLSNSKTFNWIGSLFDMVAKLNKNLQGTQWFVDTNIEHYEQDGVTETSMWQKAAKIPDEPLSFDKTYVSEVLKTSYETWEIPFVVDQIAPTDARYAQGKRFLILFGTPSNEILDDQDQPYIFRFGQGVGLKNNSRTSKNNKIVTRIVGYGSENNIPFGYPQIQWYGDQTWKYTVNNNLSAEGSLPIYKGILGGRYVNLIKHPFTRKTLMPSVYRETLFNKVSPYMSDGTPNPNFDPTIELVDYYDADNSYPNPAVSGAESVEMHQFEDIKPEFTQHSIVGVQAYDQENEQYKTYEWFIAYLNTKISNTSGNEYYVLLALRDTLTSSQRTPISKEMGYNGGSYTYNYIISSDEYFWNIKYTSDNVNFEYKVLYAQNPPEPAWDDTMDDDGNYKQSYFKMTLPQLDFDLYACASITEEMKINMRSGACIGCTFDIAVDWDDYKKNFYDSDGNFLPDGEQRDLTKYPKTNLGQVTFVVKKDLDTFGTLMPNTYQKPHSGDEFVILGISLPITYVTNAEARLDDAAKEYMRENNVHYYEYPLKFDEHFLATHTAILAQMRNNTIVRFQYGGELPMALYVKQITVKYSGVLPTYDITLTDDVEIVLNKIGRVTDDVSRMRVQVSELQKYYSENIIQAINEKLSKVIDDVCQGRITFQQGLDSIGSAIFHDELRSQDFTSGLYTGRGWRVDQLGNAELESLRVRSYLEIVELLVNRMQAQEGDTMFSDNDQIERVEEKEYNNIIYYVLSLKEKWEGYITSQKKDNILKGIINTLAANYGNVSDITEGQCVEADGINYYYTSWMKVIDPSDVGETLGRNQIAVMLYEDTDTPANKNFPPCELMTIARCGCDADPDDETLTESERQSIIRRQSVFSISTSDGRIAKLRGVRTPILQNANYGTTLGTIPDFIKQWSIYSRLIKNRDYLYAQGVIVSDFIKVDSVGDPITNYVDAGQWQNNTRYLHNAYNEQNAQWETNDVWHNGSYWRCLVTQPYNGVYYEPTDANNLYWQKLLTSGAPAPFYTQELYAWSNVESTVNATTSPFEEPYAGWSESIPQQGSYAYLWKKIVKYTYNGTTDQYDQEPAQYFRMSGTNGTSIDVKGSIDYAYSSSSVFPPASSSLNGKKAIAKEDNKIWVCQQVAPSTYDWTPSGNTASDGFSYTIVQGNFNGNYQSTSVLTGHLVMWSTEAQDWVDLGRFKGEAGVTYYAHIAWAEDVRISDGNIVVTGFVTAKLPTDTTHIWMGTYVDTNSGQDPRNASLYVWSNTKGDKGDRGNIGRFFYFAGTFNPQDNDPTHVFEVNDAQAPYFEHIENGQKRYHVFNYETNGSYTMAQMWAISSNWNNKPWESMTNDFKYIITEATFSQFAHLGSFIISGDYFISQYGTLFYNNNGTIETTVINASNVSTLFGGSVAYAWFADSDPMVDIMPTTGNYKFRPTKCIDALSGEEWMAGGNMHVSHDGDVLIKGALMYHKVYREIASANTISLFEGNTATTIKLKCDTFLLHGNYSSNVQVVLPPAKFFFGALIKIVNGTYNNSRESNPSIITLRVFHSNETEQAVEDAYNTEVNSMAISAPCKINGSEDIAYYDYYTSFALNNYSTIELVSAPNWYQNPSNPEHYVWMLIDAR